MTTTIKIYPLVRINFQNVVFYARNSGLTVLKTNGLELDNSSSDAFYQLIEVEQNLTNTQKSTIKDIFKGTAYIIFS